VTAEPERAGREGAGRRSVLAKLTAALAPDLAPVRHSRAYRLLYAGQSANQVALMICFVALPYQAYAISRSSLVVGLLSFAEVVPVLLSGLVGGALADAVERRKLIVITQVASALSLAALTVNALTVRQLWLVFLFAALLTGGLPLAYGAAVAVCVVALVPFARMPRQAAEPDADRPSLRGMTAGLRYARGRPDLLGTYLIDIGAMLFGAPYAVFPQIAAGLGGPAVLGLLFAAPGFGSLAVSLTSSWTRHVRHHGRGIAAAVCGWGMAIAAFGLAPDLPLAVLALAVAGGADSVSGLFRMTMWNQSIPARVRGRMAGIEMISYSTGEPIGNLEAGAIATLTGSVPIAVVSGGLLSIVGAAVVSLALPALWRYDAGDLQASPAAGKPSRRSA
jgi:hypothetical protein